MQFGFMYEKITIDTAFILRCLQEEYCAKGNHCMSFVDLDKTFFKVPRTVLEWEMRKKGISEILFGLMMSLYEGALAIHNGFLIVRGFCG